MEYYSLMYVFKQSMLNIIIVVSLLTIPTLVLGIVISIFQAATQINEMSLTFIPKFLVMLVILFVSLPWLMTQLVSFTQNLLYHLPQYLN